MEIVCESWRFFDMDFQGRKPVDDWIQPMHNQPKLGREYCTAIFHCQ
jgi:hypothetical protein